MAAGFLAHMYVQPPAGVIRAGGAAVGGAMTQFHAIIGLGNAFMIG